MSRRFRIGSRRSALAMEQSGWVAEKLGQLHPGFRFEIVRFKTQGDRVLSVALSKIGQKGLFTRELEEAMLRGEIDLAVHSLKDLPTELPPGLALGAVTERVDPRDVVVSHGGLGLDALPRGARVGTSALRRAAQLRHRRTDLDVESVRGNVETRLRKLDEGHFGALVMAAAGLSRLGLGDRISEYLEPETLLSAVGQGALGIEIRADDEFTREVVRRLNHPPTEAATTAERALLRRLGGGCQVPIAALGRVTGDRLRLDGMVADPDGQRLVRDRAEGPVAEADALGVALAERLLAAGAGDILKNFTDYGQ